MPFHVEDVWNHNLRRELSAMEAALSSYPIVTVDCEFPGFLVKTPRYATDELRFRDLKHNVDRTDIIQLGLTLSDRRGTVFRTWQFNFAFDLNKDAHCKESIKFLMGHGLDFDKFKADGIDRARFASLFSKIMIRKTNPLKWVAFHGLYDLAHILKAISNGRPIPETSSGFRDALGFVFDEIVDLKIMARFCPGVSDMEVGLQKLADLLNVEREGEAHQAASDCLLTARVFSEMTRRFQVRGELYTDFVYGIRERIERAPPRRPAFFSAVHYPPPPWWLPRPVLVINCHQPHRNLLLPPPCTHFRMSY